MSVLYLIRHGITEGNERHLYYGSTDIPLSEKGREELKRITYSVENVRFFTSGMRRANETLERLFGNVPFEEIPAFRELNFGRFEMHSYEELKDDPLYQAWISGDFEKNIPPEGESVEQMRQRVYAALPLLLERDSVLVSHGGTVAYIMQKLFPKENKNLWEWQPKPGCGYKIENGKFEIIP